MSLSDRINDTNAAPWVIEEIKKLEAERDELRKLAYIGEHLHEDCSWKFRFSELKAERDALAAHLERVREASVGLRNLMTVAGSSAEHYLYKMFDALAESPETSLARLKAQRQAEVLEKLKYDYSRGHAVGENPSLFKLIDDELDELRRKAEGGEA